MFFGGILGPFWAFKLTYKNGRSVILGFENELANY